jgi:SAM-dependent methyltransferase
VTPAGDPYAALGTRYATRRRPDPRIADLISAALGDARTILNVGAGTGSYEPAGRRVVAIEPSEVMIRQRPATAAPVIRGAAENLPFASQAFDAALAVPSSARS